MSAATGPGAPIALPPDEDARVRIRTDLDTTLFVEAGAGSGKTTALVERVVELVATGAVELRHLAAITFTEKAGAELRDRVRRELQVRAIAPDGLPEVAERCRAAVDQVDGAAIGTLHSFAQRILTEHPVEAALPPKLEVLDEVSSGIAFDRRWARTLDDLLADRALERTLLLLDAAKVTPRKLRALALAFDGSWDLVESRIPNTAPEPGELHAGFAAIERSMAELLHCCADCIDPDDGLAERIVAFQAFVEKVGDADELDAMDLLSDERRRPSARVVRTGGKGRWRCNIDEVRGKVIALGAQLDDLRHGVLQGCARHLGSAMRRHTLKAAQDRQSAGRLEFHDLLVLARKVLCDPDQGPVVRRSLRERYRRLLLDEFQDTDPIQIELAVRIACADPDTADADHWADVAVAPGRLFVVGDPKQSIYRFRRADISTFLEAKEHFAVAAGGAVELTANFRTGAPIIEWVNTTFGALLGEHDDEEVPTPSQPHYVDLDAQRPGAPSGPPLATIGAAAHPYGTRADVVRAAEADDVAHAVTVALADAWQVRDDTTASGWRDAKAGDITILVPARTSLPFLEEALGAAAIPFRTESSSLVYASRAVRDLLMVLRAADDPTDHLRIVSALRTPLLGCGDDDLFTHKVTNKRGWSYTTPTPPNPEHGVVSAGLAFLRELHEARHWVSPAELLDRIARDRRALELGFAEGRPRDVWRRLRYVIDQARAWSEATGGSLRAYLRWVDQQTSEGARVTEAVLPETDDDAVRIMTIHAAKGLEFPITIVSGMSTGAGGMRAAVDVVFPRDGGPVGYYLGKDVVTEEFETWKPIDEQMGYHERIRLLYVACTRACDHLVMSLHRAERKKPPDLHRKRTNAELLLAGMGPVAATLPDLGGAASPIVREPVTAPAPPPDFAAWSASRRLAIAAAARPRAVAATALTDEGEPDTGAAGDLTTDPPTLFDLLDERHMKSDTEAADPLAPEEAEAGLHKRPRDLDLPPWLKGRYGTAVGRAVHGVLQMIDLTTGEGLDAAVAAQCQAEAVPDPSEVRRLVEAARTAPTVRAAAAADHWREVYACTPIGDRLLEGYVDLLYRSPDGLVVVDHKTAATTDPAELDRRVQGYRLQGAAYALSVAQATGEPVVRVTFVFLTPAGAVERHLADLPAAVAEVRRLVEQGAEVVTR